MLAFDSNVFIYILEQNSDFFESAKDALTPIISGIDKAVVSVLTVTEISAGAPSADLSLLSHPNIVLVDIDKEIAQMAGSLRYQYKVNTPDALHLATAISNKCEALVTNDKEMAKIAKKFIPVKLLS